MIYNKPIEQITWKDIEEFCAQEIKEGAYLDYKEDFPTHLEKTLAAMANTFGGVVLIGIEETIENVPVKEIKGIPFERGLEERVFNIIISNIVPMFSPEVNVCKNEKGDKAIVIIRIPQSLNSPHAIESNTKVYIRTGNVNTPEELAKIDRVDWLKDQRKKSIVLKNDLLNQSSSRYDSLCNRVIQKYQIEGKNFQNKTKGILTVSSCPTYPSSTMRNPSELRKIIELIKVKDLYRSFSEFPYRDIFSDEGNGLLAQDSVIFINTIGENRIFHTEVNSFGLVFYRQALKRIQGEYNQRELLYLSELIARIDVFISFVARFFKEVGYWGVYRFEFQP